MPEPRTQPVELRAQVPALILGTGITTLGAVRCIGRRGIPLYVAGATGDLVRRSRWYRPLPGARVINPPDTDLSARLEALPIERMVLLPCTDAWAMAVSRLRPGLASRFPSSVAPPDILERLIDKGKFAQTLAALDVPYPRTSILREPDALRSLPVEYFRDSFLKPTSSGSFVQEYGTKAIHFETREEALRVFDDATGKGFELMLQEYIPGPASKHHFVEGFIDKAGRICGLLARRRIRMHPQDFGNSTFTETIPLSDVAGAADNLTRLLRGIGYRGVFSAEFKLDDRDGLFKILEVNARPWWYVYFAANAGVDVCHMAYRDALGERVEAVSAYRVGRTCVYPRIDLKARHAQSKGANRIGLGAMLRSWIGAEQPTLCWEDPAPGLMDLYSWARSRLRRRLGW